MSTNEQGPRAPLHQRVTLAGGELVDYVKDLIAEGSVRRLIIRKPDGDVLMAPVLAAIGAMAALVAKVQVEIIRSDEPE